MDSGGGGSSIKTATTDGASNKFPAGLRVLVVDDDPTCLKILEKMLRNCLYEVITCSRAVVALTMLRERKYLFDLVISDVRMPDMDGFKLLEHIGLEMDLPVIMMSVDDKKEVVMKGVTHGACDYLIKPVRMEALRNIWQHVVRKRRNELEQSGSYEDNDRNLRASEDVDYASSVNEGSWKGSKKRKDEEDDVDERDDSSTLKKPRVVWSVELHQQFVAAVNQLGIDKAVPKKILELMNVPGLTRENVASHLQKYRLYLSRISGGSPHQSGVNMPFMCSQKGDFAAMSSFNGLDLQAFAVSGQLPPNSFATLQAGGLARSALNSGIGIPHLDQRNPFSAEASKLRLGGSQQMNSNNKQADLYHGLPTSIEPKQLSHLHQSVQTSGLMGPQVSEGVMGFVNIPSLGTHSINHNGTVHGNQSSSLMMQMAHNEPKGSLNDISGGHPSGSSLPMGQPIFSNEIAGRVLGRNMILNGRATAYGPGSQPSSMLDFQRNHTFDLPGNGFPVGIPTGVSGLQPKGMFQDRGSLEVKGPRCFANSYGIFNENPQGKIREWGLQNNVNITYESSQHPKPLDRTIDFCFPVLAHHGVAYSQTNGLNVDGSSAGNSLVMLREGNQLGASESLVQRDFQLMEEDDQIRIFSWSKANTFSQGSCSMNSTPSSASGGISPDESKAWTPYYNSAPGEMLSDEMKAWNPFYNPSPGEMLSDEMKAWNPYYNATSGAGYQEYKDPFVFTAGGGGSVKRVEDTPFVPERGFYQPSTEETWEAYQALATLVQAQARSNLPQVVLYGVADEVLSALKSTILPSPIAKKAEIEKILEPMPDHLFNQLVEAAQLITDYYVRSPLSKADDRVALFVPEKDFYQPKSEVTCTAYNLLLEVVKNQLQFQQPQIVECVIAHEVLAILKKRDVKNSKKKEMIEESFLDKMPYDAFETLLFAADLISDFDDFTYSGVPAIGADDMARNVYIGSQNTTKRPRRTLAGFEFGCGDGGGNFDQMEPEAPTDGHDEDSMEDDNLVYSSEEESSPTDEAGDACTNSQENGVTAGVRELLLSSPKIGASDVYSSDEETRSTTGVSELSLHSPKLEYSSEEELMYLEVRGSDKEDSDGWVQVDCEENGI